jgi:hypothetical protein
LEIKGSIISESFLQVILFEIAQSFTQIYMNCFVCS